MPDVYNCEVVKIEIFNDIAYAITVLGGRLAKDARPGQFLHVKCGESLMLRRPFGICRIVDNAITFVFEVKGNGTRWLSQVKPGDTLDILGPLGNGFDFPKGNIIVVGGGFGSPPMLYAAQSAKSGVTAVLGFRDSSRVILVKEFEDVCDNVYLTTDDGSQGICGSVAAPLEELLKKGGFEAVLACGQHAMQYAVAKLCRQYRVPCQVSLEERMGCGIGACLVCVCGTRKDGVQSMSRVCKDGPVFDAENVIWEDVF